MDPVTLGLGAIGLGKAIFGRRKKFKYREPSPFSYSPDPNDPELLLRRRKALEEARVDEFNTMNEIGRAGLLGSGASFGVLGEQASRKSRILEDLESDVNAKRRGEQLQLYRDKLAFDRQRALMEDQLSANEDIAGLGALGDIGGFLGQGFLGGETLPFGDYLTKRFRKSPGLRSELLSAADYTPTPMFR